MNTKQQKELLNLYNRYQQTDKDTIKANIKAHMDNNSIKPSALAEATGIALQTVYQARKHNSIYKPDFMAAVIIADALNISIAEIIKPIPGLKIPEPVTKWTITAKQKFIKDYNVYGMDQVTEFYNITPRTATEYKRQFSEELSITG